MPSVVFMGRKPGAVVAFEHLLAREWDVKYVITPADEADWLPRPSLGDVADAAGIEVMEWRPFLGMVKDGELSAVHGGGVDWVFSYLFPHLITRPVLNLPENGVLNFHPAPLPGYGGLGGYNFAILEGQHEYGVTCHFVDEHFDTGDIVEVRRFAMDPDRVTALSLEHISQKHLIDLFRDIVAQIENAGELPRTSQCNATRYINRAEFEGQKKVPPGETGDDLERRVRAFWYPPYDGALIELGGNQYTLAASNLLQAIGPSVHADDLIYLRSHVDRNGRADHQQR
ncbi:MAG: hypothetical protein GX616_01190 [Planctomycetes bacterium]|nr:hypothetical protein [Planctomycetota bacterium]